MKHLLCAISDLDDCLGVELELPDRTLSLFLIRDPQQILAYLNRCPHTGVELNWLPNQFLDRDGQYIQCATHDARFRLHDGLCIAGPCVGQSLTPLPVSIEQGQIYLLYPES